MRLCQIVRSPRTQLTIRNNSTFTIGGNFDNGYDVYGTAVTAGYVDIDGSDVNIGGNFNNAWASDMTIDGGGTVTVTNDVNNLYGATIGVPNGALVVGGTINNSGTINATCSPSCCGSGCAILPVTLVNFDYYLSDNHVVLNWETASEINNDYFTVEKSFTGKTFSEAGFINGSGTSSIPQEYLWQDSAPWEAELAYYRLKQTDFDGTAEYLGIISVSFADFQIPVTVYPNPVLQGETVKVSGAGLKSWALRTINGTDLKDGTFSKAREIFTSELRKGVYILTVETETGILNEKVVIR